MTGFSSAGIRKAGVVFAPWVLFAVLTALVLSADVHFVRDNDQAAMLANAVRLSEGVSAGQRGWYAFDRSWLAYGFTAAVFRLERIVFGSVAVIPTANILTRLLFWTAWVLFLVRVVRRPAGRLAAWCVLATPAVLLSSVYWNTTALSSAFVAFAAVFLAKRGRGRTLFASFSLGLAAGIRADVVLLAPLLIWLFRSPFSAHKPFSFCRFSGWGRGTAGVLAMAVALAMGRLLAGGIPDATDFFFIPRVTLGYLVFGGFGIAVALLVLIIGWRPGQGGRRIFQVAGLLALLLPAAFYLPQLHTPRYLLRAGEAILLLTVVPRGRAWLRRSFPASHSGRVALAVAVALPLILGVRLPALSRPRVTLSAPTLMPTGDGAMPMGATAAFLARLRHASVRPVDHNQLLWKAIRQTSFLPKRGPWPVLVSPQLGLFDLHAALSGTTIERISIGKAAERNHFFSETRMLLRRDPKQPGFNTAADVLIDRPAIEAGPNIDGISVVCFGPGDSTWSRTIRLLRRLFGGAEYRIRPAFADRADEGHAVVFFSEFPFRVREERHGKPFRRLASEWDESTRYYSIFCPGRVDARRVVEFQAGVDVRRAVRVLPDWMTL